MRIGWHPIAKQRSETSTVREMRFLIKWPLLAFSELHKPLNGVAKLGLNERASFIALVNQILSRAATALGPVALEAGGPDFECPLHCT